MLTITLDKIQHGWEEAYTNMPEFIKDDDSMEFTVEDGTLFVYFPKEEGIEDINRMVAYWDLYHTEWINCRDGKTVTDKFIATFDETR